MPDAFSYSTFFEEYSKWKRKIRKKISNWDLPKVIEIFGTALLGVFKDQFLPKKINQDKKSKLSDILKNYSSEIIVDSFIFELFLKKLYKNIKNIKNNEISEFFACVFSWNKHFPRLKREFQKTLLNKFTLTSDFLLNHKSNKISPFVFSYIAEKMLYTDDKIEQPDSGTFFTPESNIKLICYNVLLHYFQNNTDFDKKTLITLVSGLASEKSGRTTKKSNLNSIFDSLKGLKVLDPACGTGKFLLEMCEDLLNLHFILQDSAGVVQNINSIISKILSILHGIDINPSIIFKCKFLLLMKVLQLYLTYSENLSNDELEDRHYLNINSVNDFVHLINSNILIADFIWPQLFSRDFETRKYDIIIGNPPFVRQENIKPSGIAEVKFISQNPKDEKENLNSNYRDSIHDYFTQLYQGKSKISKRSDIYIYFFYMGLLKLKQKGILALITSNSWLNIGFGFRFQEYILKHTLIKAITIYNVKTFKSVDINTITTYLVSPCLSYLRDKKEKQSLSKKVKKSNLVRFINIYDDAYTLLEAGNYHKIFQDIHQYDEKFENISIKEFKQPSCRIRVINQLLLEHFGYKDESSLHYNGTRWENLFFMAPISVFNILNLLGGKLARLVDIVDIKRGITTGINKFFILKHIQPGKDKNSNIIRVRNGFNDVFDIESKFLIPILNTPKLVESPVMNKKELTQSLLYIPDRFSRQELRNYNVFDYITYGENLKLKHPKGTRKNKKLIGVQNVPSLRNKDKWYSLKVNKTNLYADLYIQKIYNDIYKFYINSHRVDPLKLLALNNFYAIKLKHNSNENMQCLLGSLLSFLFPLSIELSARRTFGGGALDTATFDIGNIIVLDPKLLSKKVKQDISIEVDKLIHKQFEAVTHKKWKKQTQNLNALIIRALNLDGINLQSMYQTLEELITQRLSKAKT
ncbi:MAG: hypothetical protein GF364_14720 [Candidatus Lokiarchaeota archaeon]|nr:hypothetical protein [Candidatus Lokiarchaeota archaeon]